MFNILEKIYMNLMCIDLFSKNNFYIKWFFKDICYIDLTRVF